jgi:hypothetical protein
MKDNFRNKNEITAIICDNQLLITPLESSNFSLKVKVCQNGPEEINRTFQQYLTT